MAFDPDQYLAEKTAGTQKSEASASFDPDAYLAERTGAMPEETPGRLERVNIPGVLGAVMNPGVREASRRALDYAAGLARTAAATPTGQVTLADLGEALRGRAPGSAEYAERAGVPEGPSIDLPILGHVSARGAVGAVADAALDPLTYLNPAGRIMKYGFGAGAVPEMTARAGKSIYKSALKRIDEEVARYGKAPVSDILMRERVTGSAPTIAEKMSALADERLGKRNAILSDATAAGGQASVARSIEPAQEFVQKMKAIDNPEQAQAIQTFQDRLASYIDRKGPAPTPEQMSAWKTTSASRVGDKNWEALSRAPEAKAFNKALAYGQRIATEEGVAKALGPEAGAALNRHNDELGRLLSSSERAAQDARLETRKNTVTSVDGMLAGIHGVWPLLIKKGTDIAKMTGPRTSVGLGLSDLGQTRLPDVMARRGLSTWGQVKEKEKK